MNSFFPKMQYAITFSGKKYFKLNLDNAEKELNTWL